MSNQAQEYWNDGQCIFAQIDGTEKKDGSASYVCLACNTQTAPTLSSGNQIKANCRKPIRKTDPLPPGANLCEFITIHNKNLSSGKTRAICQWCGNTAMEDSQEDIDAIAEICHGERTAELKGPPLAVKAFNLARAYTAHIKAGHPECTQEEINRRFEICVPCDMYNKFPDPHGSCCDCGCYVSTLLASEGLNKLAWGDQFCNHPDGSKWGQVRKDLGPGK